jgi:hypothetical protein
MRHPNLAMVLFLGVAFGCGGGDGAQSSPSASPDDASPRDALSSDSLGDGGGSSSGGADASTSPGGAVSDTGGADNGPARSAVAGVRAFFTDLTSGPNSGGQSGMGAFVSVYGHGFGTTRGAGSVTIGGSAADNYPIWSDTRIAFQLGAAARTGDIVVHVPSTGDSNALPFTVRSGMIAFVSSSGSDSNDGSYAHPWATIPKAKNAIPQGGIAYVGTHAGDSVSQTTQDASSPYNCALGMSYNDGTNAGVAGMPKALVVYPGGAATIGTDVGLQRGILTPGITGTFDYWVIAGFTLRGAAEAIALENQPVGWRIVGNDISCPNGSGLTGCVTGGPTDLKFFGNVVHDAAASVTSISKYYHGVYWGSSHIEMGWNVIVDGKTCRAIQFHDTGGPNEFDLSVHDNLIHGTVCDGINFATVDPSQGKVEAYNNIIYDVGHGPDPVEASSAYAGIYVAGTTEAGLPGGGTVEIYNNTLYDCGSWTKDSSAGAFDMAGTNPALTMHLVNNLVYARPGEHYLSPSSTASLVSGSSNGWYGGGAAPSGLTASIASDPLFANTAVFDFHLTAGSPAIDVGMMTAAATDFDGNPRPQGAGWDIGAYEFVK